MKFVTIVFQKLQPQIHRQLDSTDNVTYPHKRMAITAHSVGLFDFMSMSHQKGLKIHSHLINVTLTDKMGMQPILYIIVSIKKIKDATRQRYEVVTKSFGVNRPSRSIHTKWKGNRR